MGILREEDKKSKGMRIEDAVVQIDYNDYVFDDSSDEEEFVVLSLEHSEEEEQLPPVNPIHRLKYEQRMSRRNAKYNAQKAVREANRPTMCASTEPIVKKHMGERKTRRIEHARVLAQFADQNDIRFDCSDLIEETFSAFARLMQNQEAMRVWNEFIEKDEQEQENFLRELDRELGGEFSKLGFDEDEKRAFHPGYSAKTSFQRLDKKFKSALSKKSGVRLELIEKLENQFRNFFNQNPNGVWSETITSNQNRFYLHAVAQFLMLQSRSRETASQGGQVTEVYNPRKKFEPPTEPLHAFLHKKFNRNQKRIAS